MIEILIAEAKLWWPAIAAMSGLVFGTILCGGILQSMDRRKNGR